MASARPRSEPCNAMHEGSSDATLAIRKVDAMRCLSCALGLVLAAALPSADLETRDMSQTTVPKTADLNRLIAQFAPVDIRADVSALPDAERRALGRIVEAARIMDAIFTRQVWSGNE